MDAAGPASILTPLVKATVILTMFACFAGFSGEVSAQSIPSDAVVAQAEDLLAHQQWQQLADLAARSNPRSAELEYLYGTALARMGRWQDAGAAFKRGHRLAPGDARFPIELAGVEFKQKHYAEASAQLRHALVISPDDAYANEFLGTVYFLQRNLEAALKYWNRVGKPEIAELADADKCGVLFRVPHL